MRDKAEARAFKRQQMLNLKNGSQQASQPENKAVVAAVTPANESGEITKPDNCYYCNGTGQHVGVFKTVECATCNGCGLDITDPIAVIKWQAKQLDKARFHYKKQAVAFTDLLQRYGVEKYRDENLLMAMRGKDLKGRLD